MVGVSRVPSGQVVARGDWDDVAASVYAAVRDQEVAIVSETAGAQTLEFGLLTIRDERGMLVATRGLHDEVVLTCTIGNGEPDRERMLMQRVSRRLKELHGVGTRPMGS